MEAIRHKKIIQKSGDNFRIVPANRVLKNIDLVGFFFGAYWCPPCRTFTPPLSRFYRVLKNEGLSFEIVYVSADVDDSVMYQYMRQSHEDWLAVNVDRDDTLSDDLSYSLNTRALPSLVIVRRNGFIITREGRWDIFQRDAVAVYKMWSESLGSPSESVVTKAGACARFFSCCR